MKLVVGLGNPGQKYKNNRHNAGFMLVDFLISHIVVSPHLENKFDSMVFYNHVAETAYVRPMTTMNLSGGAVKKIKDFYKVDLKDVVIIHDDLDIALGQFKIQFGVGPKVHNGLASIEEALGTNEFWRVRIGVDNRDPGNRTSGDEYVLQDFMKEEFEILRNLFPKVWEVLKNKLT